MPDDQPTPANTTPILAAVTTVGLGVVISLFWMRHSLESAEDSREYLQEKLISTLEKSAAASERVAVHVEASNEVTQDFAIQLDDLGDEQRELNRWISTMINHVIGSDDNNEQK